MTNETLTFRKVSYPYRKVRAKALYDIEAQYETIEKGSTVEGFLNSYHLMSCYSVQVEVQGESGGIGSGIYTVNVPIDIDTLHVIEQPSEVENKMITLGEAKLLDHHNDVYGPGSTDWL